MEKKDISDLKTKREGLKILSFYNKHNGWWHFLATLEAKCKDPEFIRECYEEYLI